MKVRSPVSGSDLVRHARCYLSVSNAITLLALTLFVNLFSLALPLFSMQVFDRVLTSGSLSTLALLVLVIALIVVCQGIIDGARSVMLNRIALNGERRALAVIVAELSREDGCGAIDRLSLDIFRTGPVVSTVATICDAPWCLVFIFALFLLHQALGWFALASVFVVTAMTILGHLSSAALREESSREYGTGLSALHRGSQGSPELRAMGMLGVFRDQAARHLLTAATMNSRGAERTAWFDAGLRAVRTILQIAVLAIATILVLNQDAQSGTIVAASMLFARALVPAERLIGALPYLRRLLTTVSNTQTRRSGRQPAKTALPPLQGRLEIVAASLTGPDGRNVLEDVNITIEAGQIAVVVGEQGAGKTLLLKTLLGIAVFTEGSIRMDGNAISDYERAEYSSQIGYVSEECDLGAGVVSALISRITPVDDRALLEACKLAGAHSIIQRLPQGYQTVVGGDAAPLSFGQKKRLALARAFYLRPKLLVLDDPMAGLDDEGERAVLDGIVELNRKGSTVVVASRHPRLAHLADRLIMLSGGRVSLDCGRDEVAEYLSPRLAASAA
jgi:ATP-binding cassette subfamily C protein/ATP-binding cassette subfamily C exporter for protease/lipase/ATP-binding cassette subfamily C protein EexD